MNNQNKSKNKKKLSLGFLLLLLISCNVFADFEPTAIVNVLLKMYGMQEMHLPKLDNLDDMLTQIQTMNKNLSGNFGYGNFLNSQTDLNRRLWSNDSWSDVLKMAGSGNAEQFALAQKAYAKLYPVVESNHIGSTLKEGNLTRTYYQQQSSISRAALAASSYQYDDINHHIQVVHDILTKLESEQSEKAALDLNARLVAELSFIQLDMLKQQILQTQLMATQTQRDVNGMSDASSFEIWDLH